MMNLMTKKMVFVLAAGMSLSASAALADTTIQLGNINNNNCAAAEKEIALLNFESAAVQPVCSPYSPGGYPSNNGKYYDYRLYTTVTVAGTVVPGQSFKLNDINTNNCERARALVSLLSTAQATVTATCSEYRPGGFVSRNGRAYDYRLYTTVTLNY